jgi:hypothetical protein
VITYLGAAVSAYGAVWVFLEENQYVGGAAVVILVGALISAGGALWSYGEWSYGERTKFEHELREKSNEIAELNRRIASSVTGGDSFCYLSIGSINDQTNVSMLTVVHQGEYPLYDVSLDITDLQKFRQVTATGPLTFDQMSSYRTTLQVGNVIPNSGMTLRPWQLPNSDEQDYNVRIWARNGVASQKIRLRRINGGWKSATQVRKLSADQTDSQLVREQVGPDFPLNDRGEVEWD